MMLINRATVQPLEIRELKKKKKKMMKNEKIRRGSWMMNDD